MSTARRSGVIHAWGGDAPADFTIDGPVPVFVRDPITREVVGRGTVAAGRVESGDLWADIDWPEDVERRAGSSTPAARCKFDESGRLVRVVVELDGGDDQSADSDSSTDSDSLTTQSVGRRAAMAGDPLTPDRRQAEMAANDQIPNDDATDRDRAEMAGRSGKPTDNHEPADQAEVAALRKALAESNRKNKADRLRLEEIEEAERRKKDEQLSDSDRQKRDREAERQRAAELERRAVEAEHRLEEATLERLVDREARKLEFEYPDHVYKLIDRTRVSKDEETGKWEGVQLAVERLAKEYPNLLRQRRASYGTPPREDYPGNPSRRGAPAAGQSQDPFDLAMAAVKYETM